MDLILAEGVRAALPKSIAKIVLTERERELSVMLALPSKDDIYDPMLLGRNLHLILTPPLQY